MTEQDPTTTSEVLTVIRDRRSFRGKFADRRVEHALIEEITTCGLAAPSSKNARPWRLHVVQDEDTLATIAHRVAYSPGADAYFPEARRGEAVPWSSTVVESAEILGGAPVAIFIENLGVFGGGRKRGLELTGERLEGWLVGYGFEMVGLGTAIENMWLAATALGLAGVFMGDIAVEDDFITRALGLTGELVGTLVFGWPADDVEGPTRVVGTDDRVVWHGPT